MASAWSELLPPFWSGSLVSCPRWKCRGEETQHRQMSHKDQQCRSTVSSPWEKFVSTDRIVPVIQNYLTWQICLYSVLLIFNRSTYGLLQMASIFYLELFQRQPQEVMGCFLGPFGSPSLPHTHIHKILFSFQCFLFDTLRSSELVWCVLSSSSRITYSLRFLYQNFLPSWRTLSGVDIRSLYSHFSLCWPSVRTINKVFLWQTNF